MKISAKVGASTRLYMKKFHKSQQDPNPYRRVNPGRKKGYPARRVDPGWLLRSCKYLLQVDRRRVDPLRRVEANPGSCKGGLSFKVTAFAVLEFLPCIMCVQCWEGGSVLWGCSVPWGIS